MTDKAVAGSSWAQGIKGTVSLLVREAGRQAYRYFFQIARRRVALNPRFLAIVLLQLEKKAVAIHSRRCYSILLHHRVWIVLIVDVSHHTKVFAGEKPGATARRDPVTVPKDGAGSTRGNTEVCEDAVELALNLREDEACGVGDGRRAIVLWFRSTNANESELVYSEGLAARLERKIG